MSVRNRTAPGPDRIRPEHLKNLPPLLISTLARVFTGYLSECKVPKQGETSETVLFYKKGGPHDIGNYRSICLLPVIYKLFTRVILNRIEKSWMKDSHASITRVQDAALSHLHRLEKDLRLFETEAVMEALDNQGVPTQYIKVLRKLYNNFTIGISPFYKNVIIDVKRGVRQGDTIPPNIFTATLENAM
ncbi:hypothetical protein RB195_014861 [Necator americanus]|uniref:Reverse transcriptase domain-containing protein n=1 Tax=Necator americanus TaxID=51031 RepID=A0ABR1E264_NECAM